MAADEIVVEPVVAECRFDQRDVAQCAEQDRHVAGPERALAAGGCGIGDDWRFVLDQLAESAGDATGLLLAGVALAAGGPFVGRERPEELDCGLGGRLGAIGPQRLVLAAEGVHEQSVDEIQNRRLAAEVFRERQLARLGNLRMQVAEYVGLRAAEAVDRLVHVADEEQLAIGDVAAEGPHKFDLQCIGILKFVDQQQPQIGGEPLTERFTLRVGQQLLGAIQEIVEIELSFAGLRALVLTGGIVCEIEQLESEVGRFPSGGS